MSLALVLCCCTALALQASAETEGIYTYSVENGEATITDVALNASGDVVIPETLGGCPVTAIGEEAFYACTNITTVQIPDTVTTIGAGAFKSCLDLQSVVIPDSVTTLGRDASSNCSALTEAVIGNGTVNEDDAIYLLQHVLMPEMFPLR